MKTNSWTTVVIWAGLFGVLCCTAALPAQPEPLALQQRGVPGEEETAASTVATLRSGRSLELFGEFRQVESLWDDVSLVYYDAYAVWSLDAGAHEPRRVYQYTRDSKSSGPPPVLSEDGRAWYGWLGISEQLVAMDVQSGERRTLLKLPAHVWNYKLDRHLDPRPVDRVGGCVVEDIENDRLLLVVREERNEQVAPWQRSDERVGGHRLLGVPLSGGEAETLSGPDQLTARTSSWELSLERGEWYVIRTARPGWAVDVRGLDGSLSRSISLTGGNFGNLALSPDERWLLVERPSIPGHPEARNTVDMTLEERRDFARLHHAGFVFVDLETDELREGASFGHACAWSPDGRRVAFLAPWELWMFDVESGESTLLARREGSKGPLDAQPTYVGRPVWSACGTKLAVMIGGEFVRGLSHVEERWFGKLTSPDSMDTPTLLIDFARSEFMVFDTDAREAVWLPVAQPFAGDR